MDPDYQMALLLQRQFEQENSKPNPTDFDFAQKLQDDFNRELSTENPVHLIYDHKKKSEEDGRSLVDPSWELIDPTPNIHNLFIVFNQRYFWNKLLAVCVSWSKRMTTCAGTCSYQGRGGLCCITLSEPLLKLRPRKDLVETLLHEMIHAYLFVTHNNRDRDGHGPEFHKHMYRINKEAGTNITVYHNFHDEVRLYQQHWWRCNGPCQIKKPYFGIVRRATNRAPGPNDRWWGEHSRSCGGTFIKIKGPEQKSKSQQRNKPIIITPGSDIRNFIQVISINTNTPEKKSQNKFSNVQGFNNNQTNNSKNDLNVSLVFETGNIHGFINLGSPNKAVVKGSSSNKINNIGAVATKSNSNSTIVINKNPRVSKAVKDTQIEKVDAPIFSGTGKHLDPGKTNSIHDYSVVRNHWLSKFTSTSSSNKRITDSSVPPENLKKQKTVKEDDPQKFINTIDLDDSSSNFVYCPVCQEQINESSLNDHLDACLQQQNTEANKKQICFVCNKEIAQIDYRNHVDCCFDNNIDNDDDELVECEICNIHFSKTNIETHKKSCIENMFSGDTSKGSENVCEDVFAQCPVCDEFVESKHLNNHKEKCILKEFDDLKKKHELQEFDDTISCLVCNKKVAKSELNAHLDDCMGGVFDKENDFDEPSNKNDEIQDTNHNCDNTNKVHKYNCPFCMELYSELDMSCHLDDCLNKDDENGDKSILIDSLSSEDV